MKGECKQTDPENGDEISFFIKVPKSRLKHWTKINWRREFSQV